MIDASNAMTYVTAVYWATVTCATVGYGDIVPLNKFEKTLTCFIIIFGVATFSYTQSHITTHFALLGKESKSNEEKRKVIMALKNKYEVEDELMDRITLFIKQQQESKLKLIDGLDMTYLLKVLPQSLKAQLILFIERDIISKVKFLQDREPVFYATYLEKPKIIRFFKDSLILEKGSRPNEVCFVLSGVVINTEIHKLY